MLTTTTKQLFLQRSNRASSIYIDPRRVALIPPLPALLAAHTLQLSCPFILLSPSLASPLAVAFSFAVATHFFLIAVRTQPLGFRSSAVAATMRHHRQRALERRCLLSAASVQTVLTCLRPFFARSSLGHIFCARADPIVGLRDGAAAILSAHAHALYERAHIAAYTARSSSAAGTTGSELTAVRSLTHSLFSFSACSAVPSSLRSAESTLLPLALSTAVAMSTQPLANSGVKRKADDEQPAAALSTAVTALPPPLPFAGGADLVAALANAYARNAAVLAQQSERANAAAATASASKRQKVSAATGREEGGEDGEDDEDGDEAMPAVPPATAHGPPVAPLLFKDTSKYVNGKRIRMVRERAQVSRLMRSTLRSLLRLHVHCSARALLRSVQLRCLACGWHLDRASLLATHPFLARVLAS